MGKKSKWPKYALVVGDLHVGSKVALMSPEVVVSEDDPDEATTISYNKIQEPIWDEWKKMCFRIRKLGGVDVLILTGDLTDGHNHKGSGFGLWTPMIKEQIKEAAALLDMITFGKCVGVNGSNYHVGNNLSKDDEVVTKLNGTFGTDLLVEIGNHRIHVMHKVGASSTIHRATQIHKEVMFADINSKHYGPIDIILRGHSHYYREVGECISGNMMRGFIAPCWKSRDDYSRSGSLAWLPDMGYILFTFYKDYYTWDTHIFHLESDKLFQEVKV